MIREYQQAFSAAGGSARLELLHGVPGDGHLLRLYPARWRAVADQYLASLDREIQPPRGRLRRGGADAGRAHLRKLVAGDLANFQQAEAQNSLASN